MSSPLANFLSLLYTGSKSLIKREIFNVFNILILWVYQAIDELRLTKEKELLILLSPPPL